MIAYACPALVVAAGAGGLLWLFQALRRESAIRIDGRQEPAAGRESAPEGD